MQNTNPYNSNSNAFRLFAYLMQKDKVSRAEITEYAILTMGLSLRAAQSITTTLMSPRLESNRGDPRGNLSAMGHVYYLDKLPREIIDGKREEQKYRVQFREEELPPRMRGANWVPIYLKGELLCRVVSRADGLSLKRALDDLIDKTEQAEMQKELVV